MGYTIGNICLGKWTNTWSTTMRDRPIQGGKLITMKAKYNPTYIRGGCLIEGRVIYIRIKHRYGQLGILNRYAPNSTAKRKEFWLQLMDKKLDVELCIIGGDFNMVEQQEDRGEMQVARCKGQKKMHGCKFC